MSSLDIDREEVVQGGGALFPAPVSYPVKRQPRQESGPGKVSLIWPSRLSCAEACPPSLAGAMHNCTASFHVAEGPAKLANVANRRVAQLVRALP